MLLLLPIFSCADEFGQVKAKVKIHLDSGTIGFTESFWTNTDISQKTYNVYPKDILRVKTTHGEVLLVIPNMKRSDGGALYFLFDDGKNTCEFFYAHTDIEDVFVNVFLFDINNDGEKEFVIFWADENRFRIDAYKPVESEQTSKVRVVKVFETPYMFYPRKEGADIFSIESNELYVHYNYRDQEKDAVIRINKDDKTKEPFLFPLQ